MVYPGPNRRFPSYYVHFCAIAYIHAPYAPFSTPHQSGDVLKPPNCISWTGCVQRTGQSICATPSWLTAFAVDCRPDLQGCNARV